MSVSKSKPIIAAFDFDETLILKDSLPDFLRHSFPTRTFYFNCVRALPMLIRFKLHKITNDSAKEQLLKIFLGGMSLERFSDLCSSYRERLDELVNPEALTRVAWHQKRGDHVVIVSASPESWILPWAAAHGIESVISTKLAADKQGRLTGKLSTPNCHGPEKVTRFLAEYPERNGYELYMYGDGKSDQDMFRLADKAFENRFV